MRLLMDRVISRPQQLTKVESFCLTKKLTGEMKRWNHSEKYRPFMQLAARIVGAVLSVFTLIADMCIHASLMLGKAPFVLPALPFKIFLQKVPQDLDVSSPFVHLNVAIQSATKIFYLPILVALDPDRGAGAAQISGISLEEVQEYCEEELKNLKHEYQQKAKDLEDLYRRQKECQMQIGRLQKEFLENQKENDVFSEQKNAQMVQTLLALKEEFKEVQKKIEAQMDQLNKKWQEVKEQNKPAHAKNPPLTPEGQAEDEKKIENFRKNLLEEFIQADQNPPDLKKIRLAAENAGHNPEKNKQRWSAFIHPEINEVHYVNLAKAGGVSGVHVMIDEKIDPRGSPHHVQLMQDIQNIQKGSPFKAEVPSYLEELNQKKNQADQIGEGPLFNIYGKFLKTMVQYFKELKENIPPQEIEFAYLGNFEKDAKLEIANAANSPPEIKEQRLKVYEALWKHVEPRLNQYQGKLKRSSQFHQELELQQQLKAEAAKAEKQKNQINEVLKSLEFMDVQKEAGLEINIQRTESIIQKKLEGKESNIKDFKSLIEKAQEWKQKILQDKLNLNQDLNEEFHLIIQLISEINQEYIKKYHPHYEKFFVKNSALKALSFISVKDDMDVLGYSKEINDHIKKYSKETIKDVKEFKFCLEGLRAEVEKGIFPEKLKMCQTIVALMNEGQYLPKRAKSMQFNKSNSFKKLIEQGASS